MWAAAGDSYPFSTVQAALDLQRQGVIMGQIQRLIPRLGDMTCIALLKLLPADQLTKPENVRAFLPLIRQSFEHPEFIQAPADKKPDVTMYFLNHLERDVSDESLKNQIRAAKDFILGKTAQAE